MRKTIDVRMTQVVSWVWIHTILLERVVMMDLKKRNGIIMEWESSIWLVGWLGIRTVDGKLKYLFGLHSIAK